MTTTAPAAASTTAPGTTTSPPPTTTTWAPTATSTTTTPEVTTTTRPDWWRPISAEDPLRVWVIGDSLAGTAGSALRHLAEGGAVQVVAVDFTPGTGLANPANFDWPALVADRLPEVQPDVVICLLGANDGQDIYVHGEPVVFRTPEWDDVYGGRVGALMDQLAAGVRRVYWVGQPIMADPDYDFKVRYIIRQLRAQAGLRIDVRFVDIYDLFAWAPGQYAVELPDENGNLVVVRAEDGIHFTYEGAAHLGRYLLELLGAEWG